MSSLKNLFLLDPSFVFLNHGSFGACPKEIFAAYQAWQLRLERQPVAFLEPLRGYGKWLRDARDALAQNFNVAPQDIVGMVNSTSALNVVARSLPLQAGYEILTTDHEYGALLKTWGYVCKTTGAKIITAEVPLPLHTESSFTEALLAKITPRTRVIFLSHITSPTALRFPIEAIVAEARRRGIWTVIDGAHAPGQIPLDLEALGADFYAGNCHKWLMSPKGAAFLHVRPEWQDLLVPSTISHAYLENTSARAAGGIYGNTHFVDRMEMQGTRDPAAFLTLPDVFAFHKAHHWGEVRQNCVALLQSFAQKITERTGLAPLATPEFCAPQMIALPLPPLDAEALHVSLRLNEGIEVPIIHWKNRQFLRISLQGYNSSEDLDCLYAALESRDLLRAKQ